MTLSSPCPNVTITPNCQSQPFSFLTSINLHAARDAIDADYWLRLPIYSVSPSHTEHKPRNRARHRIWRFLILQVAHLFVQIVFSSLCQKVGPYWSHIFLLRSGTEKRKKGYNALCLRNKSWRQGSKGNPTNHISAEKSRSREKIKTIQFFNDSLNLRSLLLLLLSLY